LARRNPIRLASVPINTTQASGAGAATLKGDSRETQPACARFIAISRPELVSAIKCYRSQCFPACEEGLADRYWSALVPRNGTTITIVAPWKSREQCFGRIEVAKAPEPTQRRHVRDKATIDHLVQEVYKPKPDNEKHSGH